MCGIAGVLRKGGAPLDVDTLARMAGALIHRGPDEHGIYLDDHVGLAHTRLSIVDVASGQQPMTLEAAGLVLVFNGEIFNFVELAAELSALGHRFLTKSDTEVILHAFAEWGEGCFARFNGQFAIGLWSARTRTLTLARDRYGVRPLHVAEHAGRLVFASEVKAIFAACPDLPRAIDPVGLAETFTFWTVVPPQTAFQGVSELRPGHVRVISPDGDRESDFSPTRYPLSRDEGFRGTIEDATEALEAALEKATSLRMLRADVPVGSYLSGGLDSSVVAALGLRAKGSRFRTFSLRFADAEYDETVYQREMAARLGTEHFEVEVSRRDVAEIFPDVIRHTERPLLRTAPAPLMLLSRLVRREGIKVVLTGEGADEMLAGYDLFREGKVRRFWARHPDSACRPRLIDRLYPWLLRSPTSQRAMARQFFGRDLERAGDAEFAHLPRWQSAMALQRLFGERVREGARAIDPVKRLLATLPADFARWTPLVRDQYLEIRTLLSGYLLSSQGDRVMMANSLEGRFPFLDTEVTRLADSLPPSYKLHVLDEKHVLKRAAKGLVPASILARKKQPYRAPDAVSFLGDDAPSWVGELTSESYARDAGYFEPRAVAQLWGKLRHRTGAAPPSNADNMAVVGLLSTHLLHESFVRAFSPGEPVTRPRTLLDHRTKS
jgi:asparagine synthase (glutamine-hydrolysing)